MIKKISGWNTSDSTRVGVFIRVPEPIAALFPDISDVDDSPRHVTFLIVGDVRGREAEFVAVVETCLRDSLRRTVGAHISGKPDYFVDAAHATLTWYSPVSFDYHLNQVRSRLLDRLTYEGFEVSDNFPTVWHPHITLAYGETLDSKPPAGVGGKFVVSEMEIWGLAGDSPRVVTWG